LVRGRDAIERRITARGAVTFACKLRARCMGSTLKDRIIGAIIDGENTLAGAKPSKKHHQRIIAVTII